MIERSPIDRAALIVNAKQVADKLRPFESEHEKRRTLHPDAVQILRDSDLFKVIQPQRIGGFEAGISALHAVGKELTYGCAASGWVYMVTAAHTWILGMYADSTQDELSASDPDTILPGSLASSGRLILSPGASASMAAGNSAAVVTMGSGSSLAPRNQTRRGKIPNMYMPSCRKETSK